MSNESEFVYEFIPGPEWRERISLRDWFAGQALAGIDGGNYMAEHAAGIAYTLADAMLRERERGETK